MASMSNLNCIELRKRSNSALRFFSAAAAFSLACSFFRSAARLLANNASASDNFNSLALSDNSFSYA